MAGELNHTPGPWQARFIYRMIKAARTVKGILFESPPENDWADACVMAAGPDLLLRLKHLLAAVERGEVQVRHVTRAREAIAKAEPDVPEPIG